MAGRGSSLSGLMLSRLEDDLKRCFLTDIQQKEDEQNHVFYDVLLVGLDTVNGRIDFV